jgi:hypothetical protein
MRLKGLVADKAYDSQPFCRYLCRRGANPTIPPAALRRTREKAGRALRTRPSCCQRGKVEQSFSWMDNCLRLVVRNERSVEHYQAFCVVATILSCVCLILN